MRRNILAGAVLAGEKNLCFADGCARADSNSRWIKGSFDSRAGAAT